jgi:hypothetical protein
MLCHQSNYWCHSERSEESVLLQSDTSLSAQHDKSSFMPDRVLGKHNMQCKVRHSGLLRTAMSSGYRDR